MSDRLDAGLALLREEVQVPAHPDYAAAVQRRLAQSSAPRRRTTSLHLVVAAALVLMVAGALTAYGPARRAVADLFGLEGVRVVPVSPSAPTPRTTIDEATDFGERVTLAEARDRVSFDVALPSASVLGEPDDVFVRTGPGLESVTLVYRPRPGLPEIRASDVGLILSEYAGSAAPYFEKYVDARHPPTPVTVAGTWPGLRFPGPQQVLVRDPSGEIHAEHPRLSAPSLVWQQGEVTLRLEAAIGQRRALDIAATVS